MVIQRLIQSYQNCRLIQYPHKFDEFEPSHDHEFDDEDADIFDLIVQTDVDVGDDVGDDVDDLDIGMPDDDLALIFVVNRCDMKYY